LHATPAKCCITAQRLPEELIVHAARSMRRVIREPPGEGVAVMPDYAATAKKYEELAARAADPQIAEAYRNLAAGYQLLARGTELLHQRGAPQDEA
jgi:hypothetical protein